MSLRRLHGVICSICQLVLRSTFALSSLLTTTARTDEDPVPQLMARDHASHLPHRDTASTSHTTTTLVPRRQSGRISTQAIAAIVLCSTVVLCAFIGCLLQLPAAFYSWRRRARPCTRTDTQQSTTSNTNTEELPDAEVGDQPIPMGRYLSPPPPYTRAPSYESENTEGSSDGRSTYAP